MEFKSSVVPLLEWGIKNNALPGKEYLSVFLKKAVEYEDDDLVYEVLCQAYVGRTQETIRTWFLLDTWVSTRETNFLISNGTTGLRTWPASLALAEYLVKNPQIVKDKRVLELGSGVGMLAQVCALLGALHVYATDVHEQVLRILKQNINEFISRTRCSCISVEYLDCGTQKQLDADVFLSADMVFDPELCDVLINYLKCLKNKTFLLAATKRSDLHDDFEQKLSTFNFEKTKLEIKMFPCEYGEIYLYQIY